MTDKLTSEKERQHLQTKARLEGALGYMAYLGTELNQKHFKDLNHLSQVITDDAQSISGSLGEIMQKQLEIDGFEYGLMRNLKEEKTHTATQ